MERVYEDNAKWCALDWYNDKLPLEIETLFIARLFVSLGGITTEEDALTWLTQGNGFSPAEGNALLARIGDLRSHLPSLPTLGGFKGRSRG